MPNFSQYHISRQLSAYLKQQKRDPKLISRLKDGFCLGYTSLNLYAKWLEKEPKNVDENGIYPFNLKVLDLSSENYH